MSPTILVTGGAGYIGSHVCKHLAASGYQPVVFDNLSVGHRWAVKWGPLEVGDIRDGDRLAGVLRQYRPAAVMHFAAHANVRESLAAPAMYYDNNVAGTLSLLEAMRACAVECVVFSSSCATFGVPQRLPLASDAPQLPINPYGRSKLMGEHMLADYGAAYGLRSGILRYFNAAGADPEGEVGEDHDPETRLIPNALFAACGRIPAMTLFGTDHPTADGTCVRDYIHVTDLAAGHVAAAAHLLAGGGSFALNLGTGRGASNLEVFRMVERVVGRPVPFVAAPRCAGDPPELFADPSAARALLGHDCVHSDLENIIATAWRWHKQHLCL